MKKTKRTRKRTSGQVQTRRELLAVHADRVSRRMSWRAIEAKRGLVAKNGMSARNLYLRAERLLKRA